VQALARLTPPEDGFDASASIEVRLSRATVTVELDTSGTIDIGAEIARLRKDLTTAEKELAGTTAKLGNEAFLSKAPAPVVEKITSRKQIAEEEIARITARLKELGQA
jgi:valyl-tRNA synthetase